jgi:hypothetical protein
LAIVASKVGVPRKGNRTEIVANGSLEYVVRAVGIVLEVSPVRVESLREPGKLSANRDWLSPVRRWG